MPETADRELFGWYVRSLRYEFTWRQDRRLAIWLAVSTVWMAVSGVLVFALLAWVVGD